MIERTISCAFDNGEKAYFVLPDPKSKTIHLVRGTVYETFIIVNPNLSYELIEYGVKYFDENFKRENLHKLAHDEIYKSHDAAICWGVRGIKCVKEWRDAKVDTWPADDIKSIPSFTLNQQYSD